MGVAAAFAMGCTRHRYEASEHVVAKVNTHTLTSKAFADELAQRLRAYDAITAKDEKHLRQVKEDVVRDFVIQALSEDYARENSLIVKKEDLDNEINSVRSNYPNDEAFRKSLADQNMEFKDWSEKLRFSILHRLIVTHLRGSMGNPSAEEIATYYKTNRSEFQVPEQVRLRQVVLSSESDAEAVWAQLQRGKTLKDLAPKFSLAPEAQRGGDTGWIDKGTLEVFDKAFKMERNQRSPIVKSDFGYHIFEVLDKRRAQPLPLDEVKERIRRLLAGKREQAAYTSWLELQLRKSHVFRDDAFLARMKVETKSEEE